MQILHAISVGSLQARTSQRFVGGTRVPGEYPFAPGPIAASIPTCFICRGGVFPLLPGGKGCPLRLAVGTGCEPADPGDRLVGRCLLAQLQRRGPLRQVSGFGEYRRHAVAAPLRVSLDEGQKLAIRHRPSHQRKRRDLLRAFQVFVLQRRFEVAARQVYVGLVAGVNASDRQQQQGKQDALLHQVDLSAPQPERLELPCGVLQLRPCRGGHPGYPSC